MLAELHFMLQLDSQPATGDDLCSPDLPSHVQVQVTGSTETPLLEGLSPVFPHAFGIRDMAVEDSVFDVVAGAAAYARALAVLPIDPEADRVVDALMARRQQGAKKRLLKRRK